MGMYAGRDIELREHPQIKHSDLAVMSIGSPLSARDLNLMTVKSWKDFPWDPPCMGTALWIESRKPETLAEMFNTIISNS